MRTSRNCLGLALALFVVGAGANAQDDKAQTKGPARRMQGEWSFTMPDGNSGTWVFADDKVTVTAGDRKYVAKFTTNRRAEPHRTIDFEVTEGPDDAAGKTVLGIFKFDGRNKLTICVGSPDEDRPSEFKSEDDRIHLFELERKGD